VILVVVAVSFIFFADFDPSAALGPRHLGKISGKPVDRTEFQAAVRATEVSFTLSTGQMLSSMPGMQDMLMQETWNRLILLDAAREAGLQAGDAEVTQFITSHPLFQEEGVFNPERFRRFASLFFDPPGVEIPEGMNLEKFEILVREEIIIQKFTELLESPAVITGREVTQRLNRTLGEVTLRTAKLERGQVARDLNPEEEDLRSFYIQNQQQYLNPEARRFQYVLFQAPTNAESEEERKRLKRAAGEKAFQFSDPFYQAQQENLPLPNFEEMAKESGLDVQLTQYFTANSTPDVFTGNQKISQAAFALTPQAPVSDALETENGYLVLKLEDIQPARPKPFEDVADAVENQYRQDEILRRLNVEGRKMANTLKTQLLQGADWKTALAESGFTEGKPLTLIPGQVQQDASRLERLAAQQSLSLNPGETTPFQLEEDAGYVFYLEKRELPTPELVEQNEEATERRLAAQKGAMLVRDWMQTRITAPGTEIPMLNGNAAL